MAQIRSYGATAVAVSVDATSESSKLARRLDSTFLLLSDPSLAAIRAYGVEDVGNDIAKPATFVIDRGGEVAWIYVGDDKRDRPAAAAVLGVLQRL